MNLPARIWTAGVAYLALVIGAGLSIAGNVADTFRTRQDAVDTLDIVFAVSWPALVVLMVEMFVSRRWTGQGWPMQVLRWTGCLSIGAMAMRVSWVHLNDLMLSRGQDTDVAVLGPLAIDALAIMATALILSGRGQTKPMSIQMTLDNRDSTWTPLPAEDTRPEPTAADLSQLSEVTDGVDKALTQAGQEMASEVESYLVRFVSHEPSTPPAMIPVVVPAVRPSAPRAGKLTDQDRLEIRALMMANRQFSAMSIGDARTLLAAWYGTSPKSIQRAEAGLWESSE